MKPGERVRFHIHNGWYRFGEVVAVYADSSIVRVKWFLDDYFVKESEPEIIPTRLLSKMPPPKTVVTND